MKHISTKSILPLIALFSYSFLATAQESDRRMESHMKEIEKSKDKGTVIWDMDTVYAGGAPVFIVTEKSNGLLQPKDFIVKSLTGTELIYVKYVIWTKPGTGVNGVPAQSTNYYSFFFDDTKGVAEVSYPRRIWKDVYESGLIANNAINSDAETKFIAQNGTKFSDQIKAEQQQPQVVVVNAPAPNTIVERNRNGGILILNNQVQQAQVNIGYVQMTQTAQNGDIFKTISIFFPGGAKVAEATCVGINNHNWNVVTLKDNKSFVIASSFNNDAMDVVKYLISYYYF